MSINTCTKSIAVPLGYMISCYCEEVMEMITATRLKKILGLSRKEYLNLIYRHKEIQDKETGKKMVKLSANQFLKPKKGGWRIFI